MQRWHGCSGDVAAAGFGPLTRYCVVLRGTPYDERDFVAVHARLADAEWAAERVRSVVVYGLWPGEGQLWAPDADARVAALATGFGSHDRYVQQRSLSVETRLSREALAERLLRAFGRDRLIEAEIADDPD